MDDSSLSHDSPEPGARPSAPLSVPSSVPLSAASWAEQLGDAIPYVDDIAPASLDLVQHVRELIRLVVLTDVAPEARARATDLVVDACNTLAAATRPHTVMLMRHRDGRIDNVTQAGSGCLNPQAPDIRFIDVPADPPRGQPTRPVEIVAECVLTAAHVGPPSGAHGGVVATVLDQALGLAARAAGVSGMTASLTVSYRRPTPIDVMLRVAARVTEVDGRKSSATGEITVDGVVVAEATALFIREAP